MSSFNNNEKRLAQILSRFPVLKKGAKKAYQYINYFLYKKDYTFRASCPIYEIPSEEETFFGYYDKSPLSADNRYLLFHQSPHTTRRSPMDHRSGVIKVCVWDTAQNRVVQTHETSAFNWQQGARAQWLDESRYIFNFFDGAFRSKIVDVSSGKEDVLPFPVYDVWKDEFAYSLNFRRLATLRPDYGYNNLGLLSASQTAETGKDGIFMIDFGNKSTELIISLDNLKGFHPQPFMEKADHKVNHIMIAPDGRHFIFLHRYIVGGRRFDRLILADRAGNLLKVLADKEMVSHCCWAGNDTVIGYFRDTSNGDKYYSVNIHSGQISLLGGTIINTFGDGHPTFLDGRLLFDTYPNKARMKELYIFDLNSEQLTKLGEFFEDLVYYGETRCDLHPRFSLDGRRVFFDSVHDGKRKLHWIDLK